MSVPDKDANWDSITDELRRMAEHAFIGALVIRRGMPDDPLPDLERWFKPERLRWAPMRAVYLALRSVDPEGIKSDRGQAEGRAQYYHRGTNSLPVAEGYGPESSSAGGDIYQMVTRELSAAWRSLNLVGQPNFTGADLSTLVEECPEPKNAVAYSQLLVELANRQAELDNVLRLQQEAADVDFTDLDHLEHLKWANQTARSLVEEHASDLRDRKAFLNRLDRPIDPQGTNGAILSDNGEPVTLAAARESEVVASVCHTPQLLLEPEITALQPEHFTSPTLAALFDAVRALHTAGEPVDPLLAVAYADRIRPWTENTTLPLAFKMLRTSNIGSGALVEAEAIYAHAQQAAALHTTQHILDSSRFPPPPQTPTVVDVSPEPRSTSGVSLLRSSAANAQTQTAQTPTNRQPEPPSAPRVSLIKLPNGGATTQTTTHPPTARPVVVVVVGADSSSTRQTTASIVPILAKRPGAGPVVLDGRYPPSHPLASVLREANATTSAERYAAAANHLRETRRDAVIESRARDSQALTAELRRFQQAGFRIEVAAAVGSSAHSALIGAALGTPPVPPKALAAALDHLEAEGVADTIAVFSPERTAVYLNHSARQPDGTTTYLKAPIAAEAVAEEVSRPRTDAEDVAFAAEYALLAAAAPMEQRTVVDDIARQNSSPYIRAAWEAVQTFDAQSGDPDREHSGTSLDLAAMSDGQLRRATEQALRGVQAAAASERVLGEKYASIQAEDQAGERLEAGRTTSYEAGSLDRDTASVADSADLHRLAAGLERAHAVTGLRRAHLVRLLTEQVDRSKLSPDQRQSARLRHLTSSTRLNEHAALNDSELAARTADARRRTRTARRSLNHALTVLAQTLQPGHARDQQERLEEIARSRGWTAEKLASAKKVQSADQDRAKKDVTREAKALKATEQEQFSLERECMRRAEMTPAERVAEYRAATRKHRASPPPRRIHRVPPRPTSPRMGRASARL